VTQLKVTMQQSGKSVEWVARKLAFRTLESMPNWAMLLGCELSLLPHLYSVPSSLPLFKPVFLRNSPGLRNSRLQGHSLTEP
jgi:hypothetical protein